MSRINVNATAIQVDDTDPAIVYTGNWTTRFSDNYYNSTMHTLSNVGDTISFTFSGTGIEAWGRMGSIDFDGQPVTTYAIDDGPQTSFLAPYIPPGLISPEQPFYRSPALSDGAHTILITNRNGTAPTHYNFDYFIFTPSAQTSTTSSASTTSSISATSSASTISSSSVVPAGNDTAASLPASAATVTPEVKRHSGSTPVGAIVGGVAGGLAAMIAVFAFVCLYRHHRRREERGKSRVDVFASESEVFPSPSTVGGSPTVTSAKRSFSRLSSAAVLPRALEGTSFADGGSDGSSHLRYVQPEVRQHVDSGVRVPRLSRSSLPPVYTQN